MYKLKKKNLGVSVARVAVSAILSAVLAMSVPVATYAETYNFDNGKGNITVSAETDGQYVTQENGVTHEKQLTETIITGYRDITTLSSGYAITIEAASDQKAEVTFKDLSVTTSDGYVYFSGAVLVKGAGSVDIELDGTNNLSSNSQHAGIEDALADTLTIEDSNSTSGSLTAKGGSGGAGIGGASYIYNQDKANSSDIVITGGTITAIGTSGAGIGGGEHGNGTNITITGGNVTAIGNYGAGIGGGSVGDGETITISGGTVTSYGREGAGIGGGVNGDGSNIKISGGNVTCYGGYATEFDNIGNVVINDSFSGDGAGIGGGKFGKGSNISISGGTVTTSGIKGAGIGGGATEDNYNGFHGVTGSDISITGGNVTSTSSSGAGIGGGFNSSGSGISISGESTVIAKSTNGGAGIGGGEKESGSNITISGGDVTAIGYNSGAGIGGGAKDLLSTTGVSGVGSNITISGSANVKAVGGCQVDTDNVVNLGGLGAAIGNGGYYQDGQHKGMGAECDINISGLYNTGSIRKYVAGINEQGMTDSNIQLDPTTNEHHAIVGTIDPPADHVTDPSIDPIVNPGNGNEHTVSSVFNLNGRTITLSELASMIRGDLDNISSLLAAGNIDAIKALYPNGYVLETGDITRFDREIFELLDQILQAGLEVKLSFLYEGETITVTIPANTEVSLASLCNEEGFCDFIDIYRLFMAH